MNSKSKTVEWGLFTQNPFPKFNEKNNNKHKLRKKNKRQSNKGRLILKPQSSKNCSQGKWEVEVSQKWYSSHQATLSYELVQWKECEWLKILKAHWREEIWKISQEEKALLNTSVLCQDTGENTGKSARLHFGFCSLRQVLEWEDKPILITHG